MAGSAHYHHVFFIFILYSLFSILYFFLLFSTSIITMYLLVSVGWHTKVFWGSHLFVFSLSFFLFALRSARGIVLCAGSLYGGIGTGVEGGGGGGGGLYRRLFCLFF